MRPQIILALSSLISFGIAIPSGRIRDQVSQQPLLPSLNTTFRDLILSDIPAVTDIILDAFQPGADIQYLYHGGERHRKELWERMNDTLTQAWAYRNASKTIGKVIDVDGRAVSMSIWNILKRDEEDRSSYGFTVPGLGQHSIGTRAMGCTDVPGINKTRCLDYNRQFEAISQKYIHEAYPQQLYLNLLATHPKWDGNGFAARHLHWGMELVKRMEEDEGVVGKEETGNWPLTLLATPAGYPLYRSEGFESIKNATVEMLDGLGKLWYEVMRWE